MQYLVVKAAGNIPAGAWVDVATADVSGGPPQGKADLNVRNSPTRLDDSGLTPLPGTKSALVVRSWSIAQDGKQINPPFYQVRVLAPAAEAGAPPRVLASQVVEPLDSWHRPEPDAPVATLEIKVP